MKQKRSLTTAEKITITSLIIATAGIIIQIISGANYPGVPPVFFILLIPVGLIAFGRWRWAPVIAVLGGLFLIFGFFASNSFARSLDMNKVGVAAGLWIQMLAVLVSIISGIIAAIGNYKNKTQ